MSTIDTYLEDLRARLAATSLTDSQLVAAGGRRFTTRWLTGFRSGEMRNPQAETLRALESALGECADQDRAA